MKSRLMFEKPDEGPRYPNAVRLQKANMLDQLPKEFAELEAERAKVKTYDLTQNTAIP